MSTRKSHFKSRNGCQTCKRRRVKCDEQGPPCANCVIRKSHCSYGHSSATVTATADLAIARSTPASSSSSSFSPGVASATTVTTEFSRRHLELELMHRWCTSTYKSMCGMADEKELLQVIVPRNALKHDYLMDGILALSSLDMAIASEDESESSEYARVGLEYHDRGLCTYTANLGKITPENYLAVFLFSTVCLPMSLLRPRFTPGGDSDKSARQCVSALFEALLSTAYVAVATWDLLEAGPIKTRAWLHQNVPVESLNEGTKAAIARLHTLNDDIHANQAACEVGAAGPRKVSLHESYQNSILHLEGCFARDIDGTVKGSCLSWLGLTGQHFAAAFRRSEPISLIMMMYWGVLLENLGKEAWWATQVGKNLIMELSEELQHLQFASLPVWQECIIWARQQVGLPELI